MIDSRSEPFLTVSLVAWSRTGPRIFAVPGDVLQIVFRNNLSFPANIVPSGAITNTTAAAQPGQTIAYTWDIGLQV
jgi:hypothetical protein